jgi:hypothetical protein
VNKSGLVAQLVRKRCAATGERPAVVRPELCGLVSALSTSQREALVDILRQAAAGRHRSTASSRAADLVVDFRPLALPDAADHDQQRLETAVLRAAVGAVKRLHRRPRASMLVPTHAIASIRLDGHYAQHPEVILTGPDALASLLVEVLPQLDEEIVGLPGIRAHYRRDRVILALLGTSAMVTIGDVDREIWDAAQTYMRHAVEGDLDHVFVGLRCPEHLSAAEEEHLRAWPEQVGPQNVGSAVLRRIGLLRSALYVDMWPDSWGWKIEANGVGTPEGIGSALIDPIFGLRDHRINHWSPEFIVLSNPKSTRTFRTGRTEQSRLTIRAGFASQPRWEIERHERLVLPEWSVWNDTDAARRGQPGRLQWVTRRAAYTKERPAAARAGVGKHTGHGLDRCSKRQQRLRALLAVHVLNTGASAAEAVVSGVAGIISRDLVLSPRYDDLVIFTDTPAAVAGCIAGRAHQRLPGMRLESRQGDTLVLRHLPTTATLTVRNELDTGRRAVQTSKDEASWALLQTPFDDDERVALDAVPAMSDSARQLIAGLFVRMSCRHPYSGWDIGTWSQDPLDRPRPRSARRFRSERRLWGNGDHWELSWSDYPYGDDLLACLVDPIIGLEGLSVILGEEANEARLGSAVLVMRPRLHSHEYLDEREEYRPRRVRSRTGSLGSIRGGASSDHLGRTSMTRLASRSERQASPTQTRRPGELSHKRTAGDSNSARGEQ